MIDDNTKNLQRDKNVSNKTRFPEVYERKKSNKVEISINKTGKNLMADCLTIAQKLGTKYGEVKRNKKQQTRWSEVIVRTEHCLNRPWILYKANDKSVKFEDEKAHQNPPVDVPASESRTTSQ